MSNERFQVAPVRQYEGARYPAGAEPDDELQEERPHPLTLLVAMIVVVGVAIGLIGCYLRSDYTPETPLPDGGFDSGPDGDPPPGCDDDALRCADDWTLERCDDGAWAEQACDDYCREVYGPDYGSWYGCDATSDNPCGCEYDVLDGVEAWCDPEVSICMDDATLGVCDPLAGEYLPVNCEEYCDEQYGIDAYSNGCDATAADPCQCVTDILDGVMVECDPDDIYCVDAETVQRCADGLPYTQSCADYCVEQHGEGVVSGGCDDSLEDPCQCEEAVSGSGGE